MKTSNVRIETAGNKFPRGFSIHAGDLPRVSIFVLIGKTRNWDKKPPDRGLMHKKVYWRRRLCVFPSLPVGVSYVSVCNYFLGGGQFRQEKKIVFAPENISAAPRIFRHAGEHRSWQNWVKLPGTPIVQ